MTASGDDSDSAAFARAGAHGKVTWVDLEGGCHESFTTTTIPCDLDKTLGLTIAATYVSHFATAEVIGSDDPAVLGVLDGSVVVDEVAVYSRSGGE